jgi:hypothetical protein
MVCVGLLVSFLKLPNWMAYFNLVTAIRENCFGASRATGDRELRQVSVQQHDVVK